MAQKDNDRPAAKSPRSLSGLRPFLRPYRVQIALAGLFLVLAAVSTLAFPVAMKSLIDQGVVAADPAERVMALRGHFLALFGVGAALGLFSALRFYMVTWLGERVTADLRNAVYAHVVQQSPEFFETNASGEVLSRLTTDTTLVQTVVGSSLSMGLRNAVMGIGALLMLVVTNPTVMVQVLGILDNRKQELQRTMYLLRRYAMSFGEVLGSGPFFKASLVNLAPGQFSQPFIDAAFSDLGLDPNVLLPSQLTEPGVGQPGTVPLPTPYPRTGQGGPPNLTLPDAITGNPGDPRYPYREPLPAPAPGGPPPGPPALGPAPGEVAPPTVAHPTPLPPSNNSPSGSPGVVSDPVSPVGGR